MTQPIPSPPGLPFLGNMLDLRDEDNVPIHALERLADIYGPIFKISVLGQDQIIVSDGELFEELCDETRFSKVVAPALAKLSKGGAAGLFISEHESSPDWQQAHRILMPAFGPLAIEGMFDEMHDIAVQLILKWSRMGPDFRIPVTEDFTRLTLDTIALCAMGYRFNSFYQDTTHPFVVAMNNTLASKGRSILPETVQQFVYSAANAKLEADRQLQRDTAMQLVKERRENPTDKKDLLNAMINGKDPKTGEGMRDELITANMVTFLVAGNIITQAQARYHLTL
jgi:cytochrome P450/NADPH-cytochrome P450 reductase